MYFLKEGFLMEKQSLTALILACVISSTAFTMDTLVTSDNYEPLPHDATEVIIQSKVIAKAQQERKVLIVGHKARLTDFATFLATIETTLREQRAQNRIWLDAQHHELATILAPRNEE